MHDLIDHSVFLQILGTLETVGQFLSDRLFDDARPGKADQGAGFGEMDIAEHGVGGGDAPRWSGW